MNHRFSQDTLDAITAAATAGPLTEGTLQRLLRAETFSLPASATTGLVPYDLRPEILKLYPLNTPLRNKIRRRPGVGTAHNVRRITGINATRHYGFVPEGARAQIAQVTTDEKSYTFATLGSEGSVTWEQQHAARTFVDNVALNTMLTLQDTMQKEERAIIGANKSIALGTTPTPSLSAANATPSTSLTNASHAVYCIALTHPAWQRSKVANTWGVPGTITHTDPVTGSTKTFGGGSAQISSAATVTPTAGQKIVATVTAVRGAVAYAWFCGLAGGGASAATLNQITTTNTATITAVAGAITPATYYGANAAFAAFGTDNSQNNLGYDGIISVASDPASGGYYKTLDNSGLTGDGAAGIAEWDELFQYQWENFNLGATQIYISGRDAKRAKQKVIGGGGSPLYRFVVDRTGSKNPNDMVISAGSMIGSYLNPFTGENIPVTVHPDVPPGTQIFWAESIPYPMPEVDVPYEMIVRQEYQDVPWVPRTRVYEHGTYCEEVFAVLAAFATAVISNAGDV